MSGNSILEKLDEQYKNAQNQVNMWLVKIKNYAPKVFESSFIFQNELNTRYAKYARDITDTILRTLMHYNSTRNLDVECYPLLIKFETENNDALVALQKIYYNGLENKNVLTYGQHNNFQEYIVIGRALLNRNYINMLGAYDNLNIKKQEHKITKDDILKRYLKYVILFDDLIGSHNGAGGGGYFKDGSIYPANFTSAIEPQCHKYITEYDLLNKMDLETLMTV